MRRIILSFVVYSGSTIFHISHKRQDIQKKNTEHKLGVVIFSTMFILNIPRSKKNSARYYHKCT
jgi:hypothetical protein